MRHIPRAARSHGIGAHRRGDEASGPVTEDGGSTPALLGQVQVDDRRCGDRRARVEMREPVVELPIQDGEHDRLVLGRPPQLEPATPGVLARRETLANRDWNGPNGFTKWRTRWPRCSVTSRLKKS